VDVRVIAATHQPLAELVERGRFRRDLYARLRGHELCLPPLRERREDLGLIIGALLARLAPGRPPAFSRAAGRALFRHDWPLNVRELEHVLGAALASTRGREVGADALPDELTAEAAPVAAPQDQEELLRALLARHRGNLSEVARELGTSRSQVQRLVKRWGIDLAALRRTEE
jgi:transcriptional regulator of acetoin/glycerol metabolism